MDSDNIISVVVIVLALVFAAVLTYFILAKVVAPFNTLHKGVTYINSAYSGILAWPPYFQLLNASLIINQMANYSMVYGANTAPIKVLIILNPTLPPGSNFTSINMNYIMNSSESGLVQYYILFNEYSLLVSSYSSSSLTAADVNVASIAYCLYNTVNKSAALEFLSDVGNYVDVNVTRITNLTSTSFLQQFLNNNGFNVNVTTCINSSESKVMNYQIYVGEILDYYYVPPVMFFTETGQIPVNAPVLFIIGYNNATRMSADSLNDVNLPIFIQNLETQEFIYENLNG